MVRIADFYIRHYFMNVSHKQSEKENYSLRKGTTATTVGRITPITTKKIELRILAAMDSCSCLVRPRQHGIANTWHGLGTTEFTNLID